MEGWMGLKRKVTDRGLTQDETELQEQVEKMSFG